jgi:outer membrane protein TolC
MLLWACLSSLPPTAGCVLDAFRTDAKSRTPPAAETDTARRKDASESATNIERTGYTQTQASTDVALGQPREIAEGNPGASGEPKTGEFPPPPRPVPAQEGVSAALGAESPLHLADVVASVEANYPLLLAALEEQGITSGQLLAAQGAFDLNLRAREIGQLGTYESQRALVGIDQNIAWNGLSYFAGYRHSMGEFPIYYGDRKTAEGGEFRAGVSIPLLAGRVIDRRRASLRQAELSRQIADPVIAAQRLDFVRAASRAYWSWVAAGQRYRIAQSVLKIAQDRDAQLAELVKRGAVAEIERTDNQRVIVERQARLIAAERVWQQASIGLSLYLRNEQGDPLVPSYARLPRTITEPTPLDRRKITDDIQLALQQRPELERFRLQRERVQVELDLARNQRLPGLSVGLEGYQDVGLGSNFAKTPLIKGTELDRTGYLASVQFDVPLQRRDADGRALAARSALSQLSFQERFQRDRIVSEMQDAASALERSLELLTKARENVTVARKVENGEREKFEKGQGTIVILNLRELVAAEALFAEVDAMAEYYRALADYRAAMGFRDQSSPAVAP